MYGTQASNHQVKVHPDYTVPEPYTAGNLISHLWTSLLFVFLWNYLTLLTWTLSINVDNILMLNCLVLSGLIVSEGSRKRSPNVTILFAKFQSQFDSLYYLLVKFLYCLIFLFFFMFICYQLRWTKMYTKTFANSAPPPKKFTVT